MWAKQKRNVSPNYSCWTKKQFYVRRTDAHGAPLWYLIIAYCYLLAALLS